MQRVASGLCQTLVAEAKRGTPKRRHGFEIASALIAFDVDTVTSRDHERADLRCVARLVKGSRTEATSCAPFSECESEAAGMDGFMAIKG